MMIGSLCLTEMPKSWKSCSSNRLASHTAEATSASGVTRSAFIMRWSMEPAFTPMRSAVPWSLAALAMSLTWSSKRRMLPGFTRTPAQPASIAAKTYFGWKWMSAITGIGDFFAMAGSASASSLRGQATRTMSQPAAVSSAICWSVAFTSWVGVMVIDCTVIGASPPTAMSPSLTLRVFRRGARTGGGSLMRGMPRLTEVTVPLWTPSPAGRCGTWHLHRICTGRRLVLLAERHRKPVSSVSAVARLTRRTVPPA